METALRRTTNPTKMAATGSTYGPIPRSRQEGRGDHGTGGERVLQQVQEGTADVDVFAAVALQQAY